VNKCKNCQAVLPARIDGKLGRNQLFCNVYCGKLFRGEIRFIEKPINCLWCGDVLDQRGAGHPKKFCSKEHSSAFYYASKPKAASITKSCAYCKETFMTKLTKSRFCKADCRNNFYRAVKLEATKVRQASNPRRFDFDCERCNKLVISDVRVTRGAYGKFCRSCALVLRRERYRIKTAKRQRVLNPIRISADALIERDGNICRLCSTEIDLNLARNSRWGATIDHIVPLSKGGSDELDNLQLAHWICNIKKGNRVDA
jgi:5-methylcytosine-specific restriction endonuclease McrA